MHIALVTHAFKKNDGQGRVNYEIAKYAGRAGHKVSLLAAEVGPELLEEPGIWWDKVPAGNLPTRLLGYQQFAQATGRKLHQNRDQYDIVNVNGFITYAASDINSVHFVHSGWRRSKNYAVKPGIRGYYHKLFNRINRELEQHAFAQSRCIVAVSEKIAGELRELGIPAAKIRVILNGVDTNQFMPGIVNREVLGLPPSGFLALFAGDMQDYRKNLDTVLKALVNAPKVHLVVAGHLPGSPFPALAKQLGIDNRVTFLGYRKDIAAIMQAVDVFAFPSRYEACSLVLLEALATGMPIITAKSVGGAEILTPDCGDVLDDPDDSTQLALLLSRYEASAELRAAMKKEARRVALRHTWEHMAQQYVALYEELSFKK